MKKIIFYLSAIALVLTSCKKNTEFNNYDTLTKDAWMVEDVEDEKGNSIIEDCQKDDIIQFESKSFSFIEGANNCSESMFLRSAEWSFAEDGGMIKITKAMQTTNGIGGGAVTEKYYVVTLNENELVLKKKHDNDVYYFER